MKKQRKLFVPSCYRVLSGRLQCGIALADYTVIERHDGEKFEVQRSKYASEEAISLGIQYFNSLSSARDVGALRKMVSAESVECACALYGGIVFMLDTEVLSVWNEIPEGYGLFLFGRVNLEEKKEEQVSVQIELISQALARNLKNFSKHLENYQHTLKFWEKRREVVEQSLFWGIGEDGRCFSVMPLNTLSYSNQEIFQIDTTGLHMEGFDD
ncbi:MAG: hypothetical protein QXJ27_01555 [Thermoplasmata archaeon]